MEEMSIEFGKGSEDGSDDVDQPMDENNRQMIDTALQNTNEPSTSSSSDICTSPRRDLTERLQEYDANFLDSVLPLLQ